LTLEQLAVLIGSKTNTISGWETGNRGVDLDDIKRIADAYGVHPAALLFAPDDQAGFESLRELLSVATAMTEESRSAWLAIGRQLAPPEN
jgi:transcriptional regulator with XRE-family HTH domain